MSELSLGKKLCYGIGGLGMNLTDLVVMQWLFVRYVPNEQQALVPVQWFGVVFLCGRIIEAMANPVVGHWSDNWRSEKGRRLPFIRGGVVPLVVVFFLLFQPPIDHAHWLNAAFALVMIPLYFIFYAVVVTPYLSLLPEITSDLHERVNLTTFQAIFIMVGTFLFALMGLILERCGWAGLGVIVGVVTCLAYVPVLAAIREKPATDMGKKEPMHFIRAFRATLANRPFLFVVLSTSLYWFGLNSVLMLVPFWVVNVLDRSKDAVTMLMVPFLVMNLASFFLFNFLAKRYGKYAMFLATLVVSGLFFALFCAVGHLPVGSTFHQTAVVLMLAGIPVAGFMVLPFAILSDVIDYDERLTGRRREAIYFGIQGIFQKTTIGLSGLSFSIVAYLGSETGRATATGLKLVSVGAGIACLLGFLVFLRYPIREREGSAVVLGG